jgi:hypothetical protein
LLWMRSVGSRTACKMSKSKIAINLPWFHSPSIKLTNNLIVVLHISIILINIVYLYLVRLSGKESFYLPLLVSCPSFSFLFSSFFMRLSSLSVVVVVKERGLGWLIIFFFCP